MSALFLYGVLRADIAGEKVEPLLTGLGPGWSATVPGKLWAIPDPRGWYPALLPGEGADAGAVQGMLHRRAMWIWRRWMPSKGRITSAPP